MMKRISLLVALLTVVAVAQQQPAPTHMTNIADRTEAPTYSDLYCAGFIGSPISAANYVVGGAETPHATKFAQGDIVFLEGSGYQEGARYTIVRASRDPNRYEPFPGQRAAIRATGQPYADLGYVRVTALRGSIAVAVVEFSCAAITNGDLVMPFQERVPVAYAQTAFERFPRGESAVHGRILMAKDFDTIVAAGHKVYLNVGSGQGVKPGDYFRVVRDYDPHKMDEVEIYSLSAPSGEDTQKNARKISTAELQRLPRQAIAEMIVLSVNPSSSTAMLTRSLYAVNVGDRVEAEPSTPFPPPAPPVVSCSADPAAVAKGGMSTITSTASSPDNRTLTYAYNASAGTIFPAGATATLDTTGAQPGPITVTCAASDDRNPPLTTSATTTVTVQAPAAPPAAPPLEASKLNDLAFKAGSARVDNVAKAVLDGVALRMQRDPDARLVLIGEANSTERNAQKLAAQRAANAKAYLVKAGIDPQRIETRTGGEGGRTTQIWFVPQGVNF
jgi:outer membrane protein OmpA-like peptidoglycan-associated protein